MVSSALSIDPTRVVHLDITRGLTASRALGYTSNSLPHVWDYHPK